ncbi:hypothetical protein D6764_03445 [Candidatus Woesearchaeota archaeon]|nr:MAG: hypothetical protein D6764_03445 [Candidatus Woesearchaeota archaeon]
MFQSISKLLDSIARGMDTFDLSQREPTALSYFESTRIAPSLYGTNDVWASYEERPVLRMNLEEITEAPYRNENLLIRILDSLSGMNSTIPLLMKLYDAENPEVGLDIAVPWLEKGDADRLRSLSDYDQVIIGGIYSAKAMLTTPEDNSSEFERQYAVDGSSKLLLRDIKYILHFAASPDYSSVVAMPGVKLFLPDGREF